ncbi:MAG: hypothetical protein EKK29_18860 [Hyphomicrobiales bacterium]|nr:MAG: hypothetical protein EKK29_18860 [Hyphomicrobiales bacterium]
MEVAAVSLLLIALVGAFLALVAALVLLRPKIERAVEFPDAMKQFVILASVLSLVCIVLYLIAEYATHESSTSIGSITRPSASIGMEVASASV